MKTLLKTACFVVLIFFCFASSSKAYMNPRAAAPSCYDDVAKVMKEPGVSPPCTPLILDNAVSKEFLKKFTVRKIKGKWYLFLTAADFNGGFDASSRWVAISTMVSVVKTVFGDNADCLIVKIPENDAEKAALLSGSYPETLIAARASISSPTKKIADDEWDEYHHRVFYRLTVY